MTSTRIELSTPDGGLPGQLWLPSAGSGPGILLLQEIFGISRYLAARAQDLADLGYVVLAPELYWRLGTSRFEEGPEALDEAMSLVQRLDWDLAVSDATVALESLRELPSVTGGVGVLGFCLGGGLAFSVAAQAEPDALVSYYGTALPDLLHLAPEVTAPSLHHFGLADSYLDPAAVRRVHDALTERPDVEFETYPGADHAFDNPDFPLHHPEASALAWQRTVDFLGARLLR